MGQQFCWGGGGGGHAPAWKDLLAHSQVVNSFNDRNYQMWNAISIKVNTTYINASLYNFTYYSYFFLIHILVDRSTTSSLFVLFLLLTNA